MKKIMVLLLVVFIFSGSALAFAWWDSLTAEEEGTIELGYGNRIVVENETTTGQGILVPESAQLYGTRTHDITFTYEVSLEESMNDELDFILSLSDVGAFSVLLEDGVTAGDNFNLINMNITVNNGTSDVWNEDYNKDATNESTTGLKLDSSTPLTVTVTFTITDPSSGQDLVDAYNSIAGATIDFDLFFEIVLP